MSIYLACIYFLIGSLVVLSIFYTFILIRNRNKSQKVAISNLKQKKSTLYVKYNIKTREIIINNYTYLNLDVSRHIISLIQKEEFLNIVKKMIKEEDYKYECDIQSENILCCFAFSFREKLEDVIILRCDYNVERIAEPISINSVDDLKAYHNKYDNKKACLYYLNIKDFNAINQRYGQKCGDYVLDVLKKRISKIDNSNLHSCYLGADQFAIYHNSRIISKKNSIKLIKDINKKIARPIDVGYIDLDVNFGVGMCIGEYEKFDDFVKCSYIAADYAKKRKKYNIVIYNESMKLEGELVNSCDRELDNILIEKNININYNPVFYYERSNFVGYISNLIFSNSAIDCDSLKKFAKQQDKYENLLSTIIDSQLINYLKKRTKKRAKLFINLNLDEVQIFLDTYLSNAAYSDCKIVICLNIKKGYEMLNKFPYISSAISKLIEEGIEFALEINYSNMYNYDYIMKNATYLILDESIVSNMNNNFVKNRFINIVELAKTYELELFAVDVKEYIQFENLLKFDVRYFSGPYFGKGAKIPSEIELTKTKIFTKFIKDSKKSKKNN